jgi:hypothetical protein
MTSQAKTDKVYLAALEAYEEHEALAQKYMKTLQELQQSTKTEPWVIEDCEDAFALHNCITAVLRDILYAGEDLPPMDDVF